MQVQNSTIYRHFYEFTISLQPHLPQILILRPLGTMKNHSQFANHYLQQIRGQNFSINIQNSAPVVAYQSKYRSASPSDHKRPREYSRTQDPVPKYAGKQRCLEILIRLPFFRWTENAPNSFAHLVAGSQTSLLLVMSRILPRTKIGLGPGGNNGLSLDFCFNQMKPAAMRAITIQNSGLKLRGLRQMTLGIELIEGKGNCSP